MVFFSPYQTVHIQGWIYNKGTMGTGPGAQAHWGGPCQIWQRAALVEQPKNQREKDEGAFKVGYL